MSECNKSSETVVKRCGVPWCRLAAYPGSDWCQFHEVVNPFDDDGKTYEQHKRDENDTLEDIARG